MTPTLPSYVTDEYLSTLHLCYGQGTGDDGSRCAMQEVNQWLSGDGTSDAAPSCVSPVIREMVIGLNDASERTRASLVPRLPLIIGTASTLEVDHRRSMRVIDYYIREWTPAWLDLVPALAEHAAALRALPIVTDENAAQAGAVVRAAGDAARAIARDSFWGAAWAAVMAASAAALVAASADASADAWADARAAAVVAAWAAAQDKLAPTVERLQDSSLALLDELIAMTNSVPQEAPLQESR